MFLMAGAMFATFFIGTLYLQQVRGYTAIETGLAFLPLALGSVIGSAIGQAAVRRVGVKPVVLVGCCSPPPASAGSARSA